MPPLSELDKKALEMAVGRREIDVARDLIIARRRIETLGTLLIVVWVLGIISGYFLRSL